MTAFDTSVQPYEERLHWLSRKDWPAGRVTHSSFIVVAALWGFSLLIGHRRHRRINHNKIAAALAESWTEWVVPSLAVFLGVVVILCAIGATLSWLRNGRSTLVIETLPAFTGGRFRGMVEAGDILAGKQSFKLTLACEEVIERTERIERSRRRKHWRISTAYSAAAPRRGSCAPPPAAPGRASACRSTSPSPPACRAAATCRTEPAINGP